MKILKYLGLTVGAFIALIVVLAILVPPVEKSQAGTAPVAASVTPEAVTTPKAEALAAAADTTPVPAFDIEAYCEEVSQVSGGSYQIKDACIDMEREALAAVQAMPDPGARIRGYCEDVARTAGGSYQIYNSCIDMELEARDGSAG